jgi:sterol 24-C-methyltransferase
MEEDLAATSPVPWYQPLDPTHISLTTFRLTPVGRFITHNMVRVFCIHEVRLLVLMN